MPGLDTELDIDPVDLSGLDGRTAFYRAWAARGAARTQAERQQAVRDGIIDADGHVLRPGSLSHADDRITVEQ